MKDSSLVLLTLGLFATVGALVYVGSKRGDALPVSPAVPKPEAVGLFPDLKVGSVLLVDTARANMPPPFSGVAEVVCVVDLVMTDRSVVSVRAVGLPGASFSGTIPRDSIVRVLPEIPPGLLQT